MGTWGIGPFANDDAADLLGSLDDAEPAVAVALLREALSAADTEEYLQVDVGQAAVAAAAIVAAQRPGGPRLDPSTVPVSLAEGSRLDLSDELDRLALVALDRVVGERSELPGLWQEGGRLQAFHATLEPLRAALASDRHADTVPAAKQQGQRRSANRQRFEPGAVLRVGLDDGTHTYARMLSHRPYLAVYDARRSDDDVDVEQIVRSPVLFVVAVAAAAYRSGRWQRVGWVPLLAAAVVIPEFFLQDIFDSQQCQVVDHLGRERAATPEECVGLERSAVWAAEHIEERVRDHYQNRPNAHLEVMKLRR
ncbi:MAG TPA: DUF4259 domain-containing protein [Actinomycetes bacterium]